MEKLEIKELPTEFVGKGEVKHAKFRLHIANSQAFVYEVDFLGSKYYEVFKRVVHRKYKMVSYPSSKSFGKWAWWYPTLEKAMIKFNELNQPKQII